MLSPGKTALIEQAIVPEWMRNDPHEAVTQEEYVERFLRAADSLALSVLEIEAFVNGEASRGEHWALIKGA